VQSQALGDLRRTAKVAIPGLRRKAEGKGFGFAPTLQIAFPTGVVDAFTSDGAVTFTPGFILDYRFGNAVLIALNGGVWVRPDGQFEGLKLGPMASFGIASEVPIVRRWGLTVLGEVFGNVSMTTLPMQPRQVPAELLLGVRWYSSKGFVLTVGAGGGCDCAFGAPSLRVFTELVWIPGKTREYAAIERFKRPPSNPDPDGDGVIGDKDKCPNDYGPVENAGCPDRDKDKDGIVDRDDKCPDDAGAPGRTDGCPLARIVGNKIVILEPVHFATDQDIVLPESFPVLTAVAETMRTHPELKQVLVEGHCDIRWTDPHNMDLSKRRAASVMRFLLANGIEPERLHSEGYGWHRPIAPNDTDWGMALNRRVEFTIERVEGGTVLDSPTVPPPPPSGVLPNKGVLPTHQNVLPDAPAPRSNLPTKSTLPGKSALPEKSTLPTKQNKHKAVLPKRSVLSPHPLDDER
jgi:outer membrane protein OmpA-like peptidoglycan-associated protein